MKGKLVVIEGTDASGKATQSKLLVKTLKKHGYAVVGVSFPRYNSFFGKLVAQYLSGKFGSKKKVPVELSALLYSLDRLEFKPELEKLLEQGKIVVCDRYSDSNYAHQSAKIKSKKQRAAFLKWLYAVESVLPKASVKIFLDMPAKASRKLLLKRGGGKDIHEADAVYLERARKVYLQLVENEKGWISINCAKKIGGSTIVKPRREIQETIWGFVKSNL